MPADIGRSNVVIPEEYIQDIITGMLADSAVMQLAAHVPMSRGSARQPVLALLPQAAFVSPRDTGLKGLTYASWDGIELIAEAIATIVPVPEDVLDDANFDIWGAIQPSISTAIAAQVDAAALFGVGAPSTWPAGGIFSFAQAAGNQLVEASVAGQDLAEDLNQIMGMVESDGFDPDGFVVRRPLKRALRGLRDAVNRPIFSPSLTADQLDNLYSERLTYTSLGWPQHVANAFVGDWDMAILGIRSDMTFKILTEAMLQNPDGSTAFNLPQQDMVALRCVTRLGFAIAKPASATSEIPTYRSTGATTFDATHATDPAAAWAVNQFASLTVTSGGSTGVVASNTATALTIGAWTGGTPANGQAFAVGEANRAPFAVLLPPA